MYSPFLDNLYEMTGQPSPQNGVRISLGSLQYFCEVGDSLSKIWGKHRDVLAKLMFSDSEISEASGGCTGTTGPRQVNPAFS